MRHTVVASVGILVGALIVAFPAPALAGEDAVLFGEHVLAQQVKRMAVRSSRQPLL